MNALAFQFPGFFPGFIKQHSRNVPLVEQTEGSKNRNLHLKGWRMAGDEHIAEPAHCSRAIGDSQPIAPFAISVRGGLPFLEGYCRKKMLDDGISTGYISNSERADLVISRHFESPE